MKTLPIVLLLCSTSLAGMMRMEVDMLIDQGGQGTVSAVLNDEDIREVWAAHLEVAGVPGLPDPWLVQADLTFARGHEFSYRWDDQPFLNYDLAVNDAGVTLELGTDLPQISWFEDAAPGIRWTVPYRIQSIDVVGVPEPSAILLILMGGSLLILIDSRRRP